MTNQRILVGDVASFPGRAGAYAALTGAPRAIEVAEHVPTPQEAADWFTGFDNARKRLAELEGELVRGEVFGESETVGE